MNNKSCQTANLCIEREQSDVETACEENVDNGRFADDHSKTLNLLVRIKVIGHFGDVIKCYIWGPNRVCSIEDEVENYKILISETSQKLQAFSIEY